MSERASFVTEYIYCEKCLSAAKGVLLGREKYLCSQQISGVDTHPLPIIAGKIGGLGTADEVIALENLIEQLEPKICHPLRIALLTDNAKEHDGIITVQPQITLAP